MSKIRVGINGFGRIGRLVMRSAANNNTRSSPSTTLSYQPST